MLIRPRPLILSLSELSAALAGQLSQIRRPCAIHLAGVPSRFPCHDLEGGGYGFFGEERDYRCPLGGPGTRLIVKETYALTPTTAYGYLEHRLNPANEWESAVYKEGWERCRPGRWRSPATMPVWASRLTMIVEGVKVERGNAGWEWAVNVRGELSNAN